MTPLLILLKASILFVSAGVIHVLYGRRMSAAARHLMWTLVVVGFLLLPVLSSLLPPWTALNSPAGNTLMPAGIEQRLPDLISETAQTRVPSNTPVATSISPAIRPRISWSGVFAMVYATGVFLLLVRLIVGRVSIQRLVRNATEVTDPQWTQLLRECMEQMDVRRTVRLLRSREEVMPMALGIRGGAIVIPAVADMWSEDRRRAVLLHEMSHLTRHDCVTQMLAAVACAVYWVHPGAWWIARRLCVERELACDDRVLFSGTDAREYAGHLLELAYALRSGRPPAHAVSMASSTQLEGRLLAVLDGARNRMVPARRSHLAGLAILILLLLPLAAATISGGQVAVAQPAPQPGAAAVFAQKAAPVQAADVPGTWEIRPANQPRNVYLQLREGHGSYGTTLDLDRTPGLPAGFPGIGGPVQFSLQRDAGTFTVEGVIRNGVGAGTYRFTPSATFAAELVKRGLERPTAGEQRMMAGADIGFAFLDELAAQHYARPAHLAELVEAAHRGVSLSYLREMGQLGYHFENLAALVDLANHGVSPEFIRELATQGLAHLSPEDLRRARTSGVDPEYIRDLSGLGYPKLSLDELVQLRRHGVDPDYVRDLAALGYPKLSLDTLIQLRNHGVDPEYVRDLSALGYQKLPLDALIQLRNHGVDPEYARELGTLGYAKLPLDTLVNLRNHGVDPEYVRDIQNLGYSRLKLEDFIRMRSSGIGPDEIRSANARARTQLSVDSLVALAARGWR